MAGKMQARERQKKTKRERPSSKGRSFSYAVWENGRLVHAAHARITRRDGRRILLRDVRHEGFGGQHGRRDGSRVLQRAAGHLGRVDDAGLNHIDVLVVQRVIAVARLLGALDLLDDDGAFHARVGRDLANRLFQRAQVFASPLNFGSSA